MRRAELFTGGECLKAEPINKEPAAETALFIVMGALYMVFFLIIRNFLCRLLTAGGIKTILALFILLILSPFGAHLTSIILVRLRKKVL